MGRKLTLDDCVRKTTTKDRNGHESEKVQLIPNLFGDWMIQEYHICKISSVIHIYHEGLYSSDRNVIRGYMLRALPWISNSNRTEVFSYLQDSLTVPVREQAPPNLIPFRSSIYNIENDAFLPYSADHVFLLRFPFDYKPDAPVSELVDKTVNGIAVGDADVINLIWEAFGNCFYLRNRYRGAVILYGPDGQNGKSTLLNLQIKAIGEENVSALSLQDISNSRFRLAELHGRVANVCDDNSAAYVTDSSNFKTVCTGGELTAERKGEHPFKFRPFAKIFLALNELPRMNDQTRALYSRLLIVPMLADFSKAENRDVHLIERDWTQAEMEYVVRRSVEGLKRLIEQGDFTRPESVRKQLAQFEIANDPVREFLADDPVCDGEKTDVAFARYKAWCSETGNKALKKSNFSHRVCQLCGMETTTRYDRSLPKRQSRVFVSKIQG